MDPRKPYISDPDFTLYNGGVLEVLASLPAESVHCVVTSPPYWGLRDYGVDGQIGLEPTPEAYVARMVAVFREVRRVLRSDGTCWLNISDTRSADRQWLFIPHRLALALQADGWRAEDEIVWSKKNAMPSSADNRTTRAHEMLFVFNRSRNAYYDADAIREPASWERWGDQTVKKPQPGTVSWIGPKKKQDLVGKRTYEGFNGRWDESERVQTRRALELAEQHGLTEAHIEAIRSVGITDTGKATVTQDGTGKNDPEKKRLAEEAKSALGGYYREFLIPLQRNARSVWEIPTQPYPDAHFATFPEDLPRRCILAGCPGGGVVLDPFMGSGTVALVARNLGRRSIGIELNPDYCALAARRLQQLSLLAEGAA